MVNVTVVDRAVVWVPLSVTEAETPSVRVSCTMSSVVGSTVSSNMRLMVSGSVTRMISKPSKTGGVVSAVKLLGRMAEADGIPVSKLLLTSLVALSMIDKNTVSTDTAREVAALITFSSSLEMLTFITALSPVASIVLPARLTIEDGDSRLF